MFVIFFQFGQKGVQQVRSDQVQYHFEVCDVKKPLKDIPLC